MDDRNFDSLVKNFASARSRRELVKGLGKAMAEVGAADVLLDPVRAAVEPALAPAGEIERGLAQGLGRDRAGVNRDAADALAAFDHQHRLAELGRLNGGAAARRTAADDSSG